MKKAFCLILSLILALSLSAASLAETAEDIPGTVELSYAGLRFVPPEGYRNTAGQVVMDYSEELSDGIWYAVWAYYAMTAEEYTAYMYSGDSGEDAETRINILFIAFSLGNGMDFDTFNAAVGNAFPEEYVFEIGSLGDYSFYVYMEEPNPDFTEAIGPAYAEEYTALAGAAEDVCTAFSFFEPEEQPDPYAGLVGSGFAFTAEDLDGNPVSSADLFAQNEITMVNIWATWCGPCVGELGELQDLHTRLQNDGCGIVGMLIDNDVESARALIAEYGITYPVILAPAALEDLILVEYVPTTVFVGRDGTVVSAPVIGADLEGYEAALNSLLGK